MQSLSDQCFITFITSIEDGVVFRLSDVVPKLRQLMLNAVLSNGWYRRGYLETFCDASFFDKMPYLDTRAGIRNDEILLNRFLDAIRPTPSIVEDLTDLRLNVYLHHPEPYLENERRKRSLLETGRLVSADDWKGADYRDVALNYAPVVELIKACYKLESLVLRFLLNPARSDGGYYIHNESDSLVDRAVKENALGEIFTEISDCNHIRHLQTLEIHNEHEPFMITKLFGRLESLTTLNLVLAHVPGEEWLTFLRQCQTTLQDIRLDYAVVGDELLPIPLPQLKRIRVCSWRPVCTELMMDVLQQSSTLQSVWVSICGSESETALRSLLALPTLDGISLLLDDGDERLAQTSLRLGSHIRSATIQSWHPHDRLSNSEAFRVFIASCPNLQQLHLSLISAPVASELVPIFANTARAQMLIDIELYGQLPHTLLDALFTNCNALESLTIRNCPALYDSERYLQKMVNKPRRLRLNLQDHYARIHQIYDYNFFEDDVLSDTDDELSVEEISDDDDEV